MTAPGKVFALVRLSGSMKPRQHAELTVYFAGKVVRTDDGPWPEMVHSGSRTVAAFRELARIGYKPKDVPSFHDLVSRDGGQL